MVTLYHFLCFEKQLNVKIIYLYMFVKIKTAGFEEIHPRSRKKELTSALYFSCILCDLCKKA
jgi:hypothetical protein